MLETISKGIQQLVPLTNGHIDIANELRELANVSIRLEDLGGGTIPTIYLGGTK